MEIPVNRQSRTREIVERIGSSSIQIVAGLVALAEGGDGPRGCVGTSGVGTRERGTNFRLGGLLPDLRWPNEDPPDEDGDSQGDQAEDRKVGVLFHDGVLCRMIATAATPTPISAASSSRPRL